MILYFDPATAPLRGIPKPLMERRFAEFIQNNLQTYGVRVFPTNTIDGGIPADISRARLENVYQFLTATNVVCLDVEAKDLPVLASRMPKFDSFLLGKGLESSQRVQLELNRITPDELDAKLHELAIALQAQGHDVTTTADKSEQWLNEQQEEQIVQELRKAGINVPNRPDTMDVAPEEEPSSKYDEDYGLAPRAEAEEASSDEGLAY